jgi:hypothetical protein
LFPFNWNNSFHFWFWLMAKNICFEYWLVKIILI